MGCALSASRTTSFLSGSWRSTIRDAEARSAGRVCPLCPKAYQPRDAAFIDFYFEFFLMLYNNKQPHKLSAVIIHGGEKHQMVIIFPSFPLIKVLLYFDLRWCHGIPYHKQACRWSLTVFTYSWMLFIIFSGVTSFLLRTFKGPPDLNFKH